MTVAQLLPAIRPLRGLLVLTMLAAITAPAANAQPLVPFEITSDEDFVRALREHYTKHELFIPMRDGVRLQTHVWTPKDTTRTWPFLMVRTPYSIAPYGPENFPDPKAPRVLQRLVPTRALLRSGYILVQQDVRGRLMSEGTFVDVRPLAPADKKKRGDKAAVDESTDVYDSIEWLTKNIAGNNGRVGLWGISYPGFYAAQGAVDAHPALKAVSPQAPVTDWYLGDDFHHNGALCLADAFAFYSGFGKARPKPVKKIDWSFEYDSADVYDFYLRMGPLKNANAKYLEGKIAFWNDLLAHPNRDAWWQARDPRPHYRAIKPATLVVGGWFDAEDLWGSLATYESMDRQSPSNRVSLVMGPWSHGGWHRTDGDVLGDIPFRQKTSKRFQDTIETPFFESHLKGDGALKLPEATIFVTGSNEWRAFDTWPPKEAVRQTLYFQPKNGLGTAKPTTNDAQDVDSWLSDPRRPVPFMSGASEELDHAYMTADQRFAARRPDVLVYETGVLTEDVTVGGPIDANVFFQTTGNDADVVVKLIDIWPEDTADPEPNPKGIRLGGYQQLVRGEIMRGRFRESFEKPAAFVPGQPALVRVRLPDIAHTFRAGHRIAVHVQSSWFPLFDRNPQTWVDIATADESAFQPATHGVHRTAQRSSALALPVLKGRLPAR